MTLTHSFIHWTVCNLPGHRAMRMSQKLEDQNTVFGWYVTTKTVKAHPWRLLPPRSPPSPRWSSRPGSSPSPRAARACPPPPRPPPSSPRPLGIWTSACMQQFDGHLLIIIGIGEFGEMLAVWHSEVYHRHHLSIGMSGTQYFRRRLSEWWWPLTAQGVLCTFYRQGKHWNVWSSFSYRLEILRL